MALALVGQAPRRLRNWAAAAVALAGLIAFMIWCHGQYGDALAFMHIQVYHRRHLSLLGPLVAFFAFETDPDYYLVTIACLFVAVKMIRRTPAWRWVTAWFLLLLPLATGTLQAMSSGRPRRPSGILSRNRSFRPSLSVWRRPRSPSVSIAPGLTTLTRILRSLRSVVRVRANDRSAALVALYTLTAGFPFDPTMDEVKMIEAPSRSSGSAFWTVKSAPLTLAPNVRSKSSSVMSPSGAASAMPAFAKRMSMRPLLSFTVANRRSRSESFETSPWTAVTLRPISPAAASSSLLRRPVMKT